MKNVSIFILVSFVVSNSLYATILDTDFVKYIKQHITNWEYKCVHKHNFKICSNIGILYASGKGVEQDYTKAKIFFEKSCQGDYGRGCWYLGILYENGLVQK